MVIIFITLLVSLSSSCSFQTGPIETALLSSHYEVKENENFWVAVRFTLRKNWHIYGEDPGDSGAPPGFTWKLPPGFFIKPLPWPKTRTLISHGIKNNIYENDVLFIWEGVARTNGDFALGLTVNWLGCEEACVPGTTNLFLTLKTGKLSRETPHHSLIKQWIH